MTFCSGECGLIQWICDRRPESRFRPFDSRAGIKGGGPREQLDSWLCFIFLSIMGISNKLVLVPCYLFVTKLFPFRHFLECIMKNKQPRVYGYRLLFLRQSRVPTWPRPSSSPSR